MTAQSPPSPRPTSRHFHYGFDLRFVAQAKPGGVKWQPPSHDMPFEHAIIECHGVANLQLTVLALPQNFPQFWDKKRSGIRKNCKQRVACEPFSA